MSKRPNEDSVSDLEPATKRFANQNENEIKIVAEQKLQAARSALARLDYKNTQQICTELIDSSPCDPSGPLVLRSLNLEKQGYLASSLEDAKRALKLKESKKTHLRCSFAYLAHALHHLERAQKESEDDQEESYSVSEVEMEELNDQLDALKSLEDAKPFKTRVSEDLFLHMASFFDSPSLVIFSATSKKMRSSICGSNQLFRRFRMTGGGEYINAGIEFFSQKCGNSIRGIDIIVKDSLGQRSKDLVLLSSSTLEGLWISHQGDICRLIIEVASHCPSLKFLTSNRMIGAHKSFPWLKDNLIAIPSPTSWNLRTLVWDGAGGERLDCDDVLLNSLQRARKVSIYNANVTSSWAIKLLSSTSSTLNLVSLSYVGDDGVVDELPPSMQLPNLVSLTLDRAPRLRSTQESFFKRVQAPSLEYLSLRAFRAEDLRSIHLESHPKELSLIGSGGVELEASSFIGAIKDWNELVFLELRLVSSSSFFSDLVELLTPRSRKNLENGYGNCLLLPKLRRITLGRDRSLATDGETPISANLLKDLVAARLASGRGISSATLTADNLSQVDQLPQGSPFAPVGTTVPIKTLTINVPLEVDDETLSWLEKNVPSLKIKHRVASKILEPLDPQL